MQVSSNVRPLRTFIVPSEAPLNRPACARLEYKHTGRAGVRRSFVRHRCKKLGANRRRKATDWQSPAWLIPTSSGGKEARLQGRQPRTAKARPPISGGRVGLLRPHLIGTTHEDRIRSPDREKLQSLSAASLVGITGSHGYSPSGLAVGGRCQQPSAYPPFNLAHVNQPQARPNPSLNRTLPGYRQSRLASTLGLTF